MKTHSVEYERCLLVQFLFPTYNIISFSMVTMFFFIFLHRSRQHPNIATVQWLKQVKDERKYPVLKLLLYSFHLHMFHYNLKVFLLSPSFFSCAMNYSKLELSIRILRKQFLVLLIKNGLLYLLDILGGRMFMARLRLKQWLFLRCLCHFLSVIILC